MEKYLTPEGLKKLKKEITYLKEVKRKEIAENLERCASFGDLSENSEYFEAKEAQAFLEGRIADLESLIESAVIVSDRGPKGSVQMGSTVLVDSQGAKEKFKIVGMSEASPLEGKISIDSPLGRAVLNQPEGVIIEISTPQGKTRYKILKIE